MKHTETPWVVVPYSRKKFGIGRPGRRGGGAFFLLECVNDDTKNPEAIADATFIQEACNGYDKAMELLERATQIFETSAPDKTWFRDYFLLTGQHAILTDEGWEPGESKQSYIDEAKKNGEEWVPIDEVNAPVEAHGIMG